MGGSSVLACNKRSGRKEHQIVRDIISLFPCDLATGKNGDSDIIKPSCFYHFYEFPLTIKTSRKRMKAACIILSVLTCVAIMAVCVMVKFATEVTVQERRREYTHGGAVFQLGSSMGVIALTENASAAVARRFPYVAAIIKNSSTTWTFACFASVVLVQWVVTSAHCRTEGASHRVLLHHDFSTNYTHTYPVLYWRLHDKYNATSPSPKHDIAVAKLNVDHRQLAMRASVFDDRAELNFVDVGIWKTVATMDKKVYLTNDFDKYLGKIAPSVRCFENYGIELDESLICLDLSAYDDCFTHEFGPIYSSDKVVGVLAVKPRDCDVKIAIFTNVSYYALWILKSTHSTYGVTSFQ